MYVFVEVGLPLLYFYYEVESLYAVLAEGYVSVSRDLALGALIHLDSVEHWKSEFVDRPNEVEMCILFGL